MVTIRIRQGEQIQLATLINSFGSAQVVWKISWDHQRILARRKVVTRPS